VAHLSGPFRGLEHLIQAGKPLGRALGIQGIADEPRHATNGGRPTDATFTFWLPQIVKGSLNGHSNSSIGFIVAIPNVVGLIAMIIASHHSDRTLERRYHMAALDALAGIALLLLGASHSTFLSVVLFSAVAIGTYSF
jgi:hypothetical protein